MGLFYFYSESLVHGCSRLLLEVPFTSQDRLREV